MLAKQISYTDYDGNSRNDVFYFNLTKAELTEMNMLTPGGLKQQIETAIKNEDSATIVKVFKKIILGAYGIKSSDGRRFIKSEELSTEFSQTEAYNVLFMELASDDNAMEDFIKRVIPKDMADVIDSERKSIE